MQNEIEAFRKDVAAWRGTRRQGARPYPAPMKAKALGLLARLRARGIGLDRAGQRLSIAPQTLMEWQRAASHVGLVPVRLVEATKPERQVTVRLRSPRGYMVEIPDVATAVALLRELG